MLSTIGQTQIARTRQGLCGKGFVQFNHINFVQVHACLLQQFFNRWRWAKTHDARLNPYCGCAYDFGAWLQAVFRDCVFRGHQHCRRTIINARGIACGDCAIGFDHAFELRQGFQCGGSTRKTVFVHHHRVAFFLRNGHGDDFFVEITARLRRSSALLAGQRKLVLVGTRHMELLGHVFSGLWHGFHAVQFF